MKVALLVATADQILADAARSFFDERGYDVQTASGGLECLTKLRRYMPFVLVLDQELPWGGGDGVLAHMREEHFPIVVPVVLIHSDGLSFQDIVPPVVHCLRKPVPLEVLLESVRSATTSAS